MSLDDKLRGIDAPVEVDEQGNYILSHIAIAQIKQAFDDEGYVQTLKLNGRTIVLNGKDPLGYIVHYPDEVMSAREWADELNRLDPPVTTIEGDTYYMFEVGKLDKFLEGKRAAGLEPKSADGQGAGF